MIAQLESLMAAFGGAGLTPSVPKEQTKEIDNFNKCVLDLALKLDNAFGLVHAKPTLTTVIAMTKASSSNMVDGFLTVTSTHADKIKKRNPEFWKVFPLKCTRSFTSIDEKGQESLWKYADKLNRISKRYKAACEENPTSSMAGVQLDSLCGEGLGNLKAVLKKHGVNKKNFTAFAKDIVKIIPLEELLENLPKDMVPGLNSIDTKDMVDQVLKTTTQVLFDDTTCEAICK